MRLHEGQSATLVWEYSRQLGVENIIEFFYEGYMSGGAGDYILRKIGNNSAIPADEYRDRITYTGSGQNTGFTLQDIAEGDVTGGRYMIHIVFTDPDIPNDHNNDSIISIYRK